MIVAELPKRPLPQRSALFWTWASPPMCPLAFAMRYRRFRQSWAQGRGAARSSQL